MTEKVIWLFVFVALYWAYCIFWGVKSAKLAKTATDYFIAGRQISIWVFILAATATSFSGWTFLGHPGLVFRDGFQYAYASFYAITIPFTGVLLLKRQWMLGKRYGYVTPGEMLSEYYQGDGIRILSVLVAMLFSIPYLGLQLGASGYLFNVLTDGLVPVQVGMWVLSIIVLIYVVTGGLRAVAYVDTMQCILLAAGIVITGLIALFAVGGWDALMDRFAVLAASDVGRYGTTEGLGGGDYNSYFAIPGVIQWTAGLGIEQPTGGLWTGVMIFSYMLALMGIQSAPAFTMWAFGNSDPRPFAPQQVWASAFGIGAIMVFFTTFQGMGAHFLGANPAVTAAGLAVSDTLPAVIADEPDILVPTYINLIGEHLPWLVGLLAVCALAAMQSTGAAYMSTAGAILTRDLYKRYIDPKASHTTQKLFGRLGVVAIVLSALMVATFSQDALVLIGGLAVAFGLQMLPALVGICWVPWITREGATWGLAAGLIAVIFTENFGLTLLHALGLDFWGRWPLTVHSAGWGILFNLGVCLIVSGLTQDKAARAHRDKTHAFLNEHDPRSPDARRLKPLAWTVTVAWLFFGIGPGAVLGNDLFGAPDAGVEGWLFGVPSIWAWQIILWLAGVGVMWLLAYRMGLSTVPEHEIESLCEDVGDMAGMEEVGDDLPSETYGQY
ncbi:MAG: sodium:solute symporter family protein [Magnetovibrionaceae bacterium]